jgi:hypothetical protein
MAQNHNQQFALKPSDLYVLLALLVRQAKSATYPELAAQTGLARTTATSYGTVSSAAVAKAAFWRKLHRQHFDGLRQSKYRSKLITRSGGSSQRRARSVAQDATATPAGGSRTGQTPRAVDHLSGERVADLAFAISDPINRLKLRGLQDQQSRRKRYHRGRPALESNHKLVTAQ